MHKSIIITVIAVSIISTGMVTANAKQWYATYDFSEDFDAFCDIKLNDNKPNKGADFMCMAQLYDIYEYFNKLRNISAVDTIENNIERISTVENKISDYPITTFIDEKTEDFEGTSGYYSKYSYLGTISIEPTNGIAYTILDSAVNCPQGYPVSIGWDIKDGQKAVSSTDYINYDYMKEAGFLSNVGTDTEIIRAYFECMVKHE